MPGTLIVVAGPTASGKTALAIELAQRFGTEIISADSRQFFREMSIGTAKPSPAELAAVKHHLVGSYSITEEYNAGAFEAEALSILRDLFRTRRTAILAGGSGLYIQALCNGMDELPGSSPEIRDFLIQHYRERGIAYLQEELEARDPEYFSIVDRSNPQRLLRALEVCLLSGRTYSSFRSNTRLQRDFQVVKAGLDMDRAELYGRINRRVDAMMEAGLLREAEDLYPQRHLNALQTVGYQELFSYLDGKDSLEGAVDKIKQNTRRYAKRQLTWFRRDREITWFHPSEKEKIITFIEERISGNDQGFRGL
jgi:tRNA dimethylallyltransferase